MDHIFRFGLLIGLLGLSAFFSASEVAFFSLSQSQIGSLRETGGKAGELAAHLLERPRKLLVTIYIGNELVNVSVAAVSTMLALHFFSSELAALAVGLSAFCLMVFGDISPKSFAFKYSREYALFAARPLSFFAKIVEPVQSVITSATNRLLALFTPAGESAHAGLTEDEFRAILHRGEDKGILESEEKEMILNVFELGDTKATEIMTPRTEIFALSADDGAGTIIERARRSNHSRIPICGKNIDEIIGVLYTKDLLSQNVETADLKIGGLIREPYFIPHTKMVDELLREFRKTKRHMAIIVNEFGGTEGLVTMDDVLSYVVGDESQAKGADQFARVGPGLYLVPGRMAVEIFNDRLNKNISQEDVGTVGGFVFHLFGRVPRWGESVDHDGMHFTVRKMRGAIISELLVEVPERPQGAHNGGGG
ncbi:MAG: HlyC/CorC family transporter [Nitrospinae bacterium]|nr:HlyC/CorC family transporter [Nitrospinota bacterium]